MKEDLLNKYFNKNCNKEELKQVLDWFETEAGQIYLEKKLSRKGSGPKKRNLRYIQKFPPGRF